MFGCKSDVAYFEGSVPQFFAVTEEYQEKHK
jgi:hypothetical protein